MRSERTRTAALLVLTAVAPAVEASLVAAMGFQAARGLAPQITAVPPYQFYHDLRWLLIYHNSIPGFALELVAVCVLRGLLTGALVALAWPAQVVRPRLRWLVVRNLQVALLAMVVVSPWAALSVAFSVVSLSWYLLASLIPMLLLSPFLIRAGVVEAWWRGLPSLELVGWSLLNVAMLTVAGALAASVPVWWAVPVVAIAGAANGLVRRQAVHEAVLPRRIRWQRVPVAPLAIVLTVTASLGAQAVIGVAAGGDVRWRPPIASQPLPPEVRRAVILLGGHDSTYDGRPPVDPMVERFSYRGVDPEGRPLPYGPAATHRSLESSAAVLAAHVDTLHQRTGRPVALIGQSEGALVVRTYLEKFPRSPVDTAMLFSPLVRPGRAYYPPPKDHTGWGVVAGWELRGIFTVTNFVKRTKEQPDEAFVRSMVDNAPFYRNRMLCPVPGVRMVAFLPTTTAAEAPPGEYTRIPTVELPAFHGGLLGRPVIHDRLVDFLAGEPINEPRREYGLIQRLGAAWQAPPLPLSINPAWRGAHQSDPEFTGEVCEPG